jgi:hypothetical protein
MFSQRYPTDAFRLGKTGAGNDAFANSCDASQQRIYARHLVSVEIKGKKPSAEELEKCCLTSQLGFNIKMFRGGPDGFDCYEWSEDGKYMKTQHKSRYRYVHPRSLRKRRGLHNVTD